MSVKLESTPPLAERRIVVLHLGPDLYGIGIEVIHTVIVPQAITAIPRTPAFIAGVINLRGRIVPVIDLRIRLGLPAATSDLPEQRIVIVEMAGQTAGLIVDSVSEVLRLPESAIDHPAGLVDSTLASCIRGIGRVPTEPAGEDRLILLLDVPELLMTAPEETRVRFEEREESPAAQTPFSGG